MTPSSSFLRSTVALSALTVSSSYIPTQNSHYSLYRRTLTSAGRGPRKRGRHETIRPFASCVPPSASAQIRSRTAVIRNVQEQDDASSIFETQDNVKTETSLLDAEALVESITEPALSSTEQNELNAQAESSLTATLEEIEGHSEMVTYPDSDSMLSLASVEHNVESELEESIGGDDGIVKAYNISNLDPKSSTKVVSTSTEELSDTITVLRAEPSKSPSAIDTVEAPRMSKIIKFAIPAMGVWLCSPILSMIDTSAVGLLSGTAQQAALNPAVSVTDYGGLLVAFMYTATTNLVASASEADKRLESEADGDGTMKGAKEQTAKTLITALQLALFVGIGFGLTLGTFSQQLLRALIGNDSLDPAVFAAADKYVKIRSLGMPAAVVIGSAQSACLGMQDIRSPLYVLLAAAVVNALGDAMFVGSGHPWFGGCAGAAWATVASQYAALAMFVGWLKSRPRGGGRSGLKTPVATTDDIGSTTICTNKEKPDGEKVDISSAILELTTKSEEGKPRRKKFKRTLQSISRGRQRLTGWKASSNKEESMEQQTPTNVAKSSSTPSRGVLTDRFKARDLFKLPPRAKAKQFWPFCIPVTTTAIGRISGYLAMSHVASSALGTIDMAAQAIIFSFFCCLTPVCDSLNLTAQSFVPAIYEKKPSKARSDALRQTLRNFSKVGGIFGAAIVLMVATIPILSQYFTADLNVRLAVNLAIPGLSTFFAFSGLVCVGEGMLLGQKDLKFLRNAYGAYFFAVPYCLLRHKQKALAGLQDVGVGTLWRTFSIYQIIRCCIWFCRMRQLQVRTDRQVAAEMAE